MPFERRGSSLNTNRKVYVPRSMRVGSRGDAERAGPGCEASRGSGYYRVTFVYQVGS